MSDSLKWALWGTIAAVWLLVGFGHLESAALRNPEGTTLSQLLVNLAYAWPPIVFFAGLVIGLFIGTLAAHLLWPWVPKQKRVMCAECGKTILKGD